MKAFRLLVFAALSVICVCACAQLNPFAPLPESKRRHATTATTDSTGPAILKVPVETFTGKVVLAAEGYRLKLIETGEMLRLTRAGRRSELEVEEINLQKYYEKTLNVRGMREDEWIWRAAVVGQWLRPGESAGSNLTAPPVGPRR